jgi:hypothetical protein
MIMGYFLDTFWQDTRSGFGMKNDRDFREKKGMHQASL